MRDIVSMIRSGLGCWAPGGARGNQCAEVSCRESACVPPQSKFGTTAINVSSASWTEALINGDWVRTRRVLLRSCRGARVTTTWRSGGGYWPSIRKLERWNGFLAYAMLPENVMNTVWNT